jgi:uncharacterized protein (DUF924 family)
MESTMDSGTSALATFAVSELPTPDQVLAYWFEGDASEVYRTKWFPTGQVQASTDSEIHEKFGALFRKACAGYLESWAREPKSHLALIVVLDQFARHIFRYRRLADDDHDREDADASALKHAEALTASPGWDKSFSVPEFVFAMMPFRHNATINRLKNVLTSIDAKENATNETIALLNRFRKQSLRRLQYLEDRAKVGILSPLLNILPQPNL